MTFYTDSLSTMKISSAAIFRVQSELKHKLSTKQCLRKETNGQHAKKYRSLRLFHCCFSCLFISVHSSTKQFLTFMLLILLFHQPAPLDAYVYRHEGLTQSYLYKRLTGRQRRESQREILTTLGLSHKPQEHNSKLVEISSAPLYMLGLYTTSSRSRTRFHDRQGLTSTEPPFLHNSTRSVEPVRELDGSWYDLPSDISIHVNRQIELSGIFSHEIGEANRLHGALDNGFSGVHFTSEQERTFLEQSDVIISYINTKQQQGTDKELGPSSLFLRRLRSYHFEPGRTSPHDALQFATFRLYKERSDSLLGNQTLRVQVYEKSSAANARSRLNLIGTRLVSTEEEGWLVYDVTTVFGGWIAHPQSNSGIKVSVETSEGRFVKPAKTGLVSRKGGASKQAFIVAFFTEDRQELLRLNLRKRYRRSVATTPPAESGSEWSTGFLNDDDADDGDASDVRTDYDADTERNDNPRMMTKRKTNKPKRKGKKKNRPKNSSKRKPLLEHCQRKQFQVNFKDLGWHTWIIAPKAYKAYQCYGTCRFPLNAALNATNHAIVQSLVHEKLQDLHIPEPCCAPSKLEPLEILFFNDQTKVIYKKYRDMVVSSCGCH